MNMKYLILQDGGESFRDGDIYNNINLEGILYRGILHDHSPREAQQVLDHVCAYMKQRDGAQIEYIEKIRTNGEFRLEEGYYEDAEMCAEEIAHKFNFRIIIA